MTCSFVSSNIKSPVLRACSVKEDGKIYVINCYNNKYNNPCLAQVAHLTRRLIGDRNGFLLKQE